MIKYLLAVGEMAPKLRIQLWAGAAAFLALLTLVVLVRKSSLKTSYSLLWFLGWAVCSFFIVFHQYVDKISNMLGINYSPTMLLLMMVLSLGLIILHVTTVITRQSKQINLLAQEMALLREKITCPD